LEEEAALLVRALELLRAGKVEEAEPLVRRALKVGPSNADAHALLGVILDQRGRAREAEAAYRAALRLKPTAVAPRANLGVLLARAGRAAEAAAEFEAVLRAAPGHPQATFNLGLALFELKRYEEAASLLSTPAALAQNAPEALYRLGLISAARGRAEEAAEFWQRALALRENYPEVYFALAEELRRQRRYEGAAEFYERAVTQDPARLVYRVRLGGVLMLLSRFDRALEVFNETAARFPESAEAHYFTGIAARGRGDYEAAEVALRRSLRLRPASADALAQLGFVVGERGRDAEAERLLRQAVSRDARHFYANYDLGRLLVRGRRYVEALVVLDAAARIRESDPGVRYQMFLALSRLGRKEEAERELTRFRKLDEERKTRRVSGGEEQVEDALPPPRN
jgi:Flp pilus assembly protein TadD